MSLFFRVISLVEMCFGYSRLGFPSVWLGPIPLHPQRKNLTYSVIAMVGEE